MSHLIIIATATEPQLTGWPLATVLLGGCAVVCTFIYCLTR